jgi:hypothetical protein
VRGTEWYQHMMIFARNQSRGDGRGVIFILNCKDVAEACALIESLPLSKENLMDEQFIPVGPLLPLGILIR